MKYSLCLLTLNAGDFAPRWLDAFSKQHNCDIDCLVIDSSSNDNSLSLFSLAGFRSLKIPREKFNHGDTRNLAISLCNKSDIIIFMTQDSFLSTPNSLQTLINVFYDLKVGAAYGRQLPHKFSGTIETHARLFNYPIESKIKSCFNVPSLGIKSVFISNSFSAYRRSALESVGGFPSNCIVSEDTFVAAKMILGGWEIAYCAEAQVYHSHNYSWRQEFQRYFDIGVFHAREPWIRQKFGGAEGEGRRFVISEIKFLLRRAPHLVFSACIRTGIKYLGFRVGLAEKYLPVGFKKRLSMQKSFWRTKDMESSDA